MKLYYYPDFMWWESVGPDSDLWERIFLPRVIAFKLTKRITMYMVTGSAVDMASSVEAAEFLPRHWELVWQREGSFSDSA